jgi:hypothetical protein
VEEHGTAEHPWCRDGLSHARGQLRTLQSQGQVTVQIMIPTENLSNNQWRGFKETEKGNLQSCTVETIIFQMIT